MFPRVGDDSELTPQGETVDFTDGGEEEGDGIERMKVHQRKDLVPL